MIELLVGFVALLVFGLPSLTWRLAPARDREREMRRERALAQAARRAPVFAFDDGEETRPVRSAA